MPLHRLGLLLAAALSLAAGTPRLAPAPAAPAPTVAIGCTQGALAAALAQGGTITFNCGAGAHSLLFNTPLVVTTTATINGADLITVSGQNTTSLFLLQSGAALTLTHMTLTKAFNNSDGGAISVPAGAQLTVDSSTFSDNHTGDAWSGGAIVSQGGLTILNSTFDHNSGGNGGAIDPRDGTSSTDIRNTKFTNNYTTNSTNGWGGAMLVWVGAAVTVEDSQFISNTATSGAIDSVSLINRGGAVEVTGNSSLMVDNSQFAGNAAYFGGAIASDGSLTVTRSSLHNNFVGVFDGTQGGAAIYSTGSLLVDASQLNDNQAQGAGGAIESYLGSLVIRNAELRRNQAEGGGAIEAQGNTTVLTTTLADNRSDTYGGAIDAVDHGDMSLALTVTASTLSGNSAALHGGAIEAEMRLALNNVTVSGNSGPEIIDQFGEPIGLNSVTLANNSGVGLSLQGGSLLTLRNTILANNSGGNCGAVLSGTVATSLSSDNSCSLLGGHDGVDPVLSALGNHGGPTLTQMIAPGSPAEDHGGFCPATDQRGLSRTGPGTGLACDIGAVERQAGELFGRVFLPLSRR